MNPCVSISADHRPDHMAGVERSGPPHLDDRIFGDPGVMLHSAAMCAWLPAASFSTLDLVEFRTGSRNSVPGLEVIAIDDGGCDETKLDLLQLPDGFGRSRLRSEQERGARILHCPEFLYK